MEIIDRILLIWKDLDVSRNKFETSIGKSSGYLNNTKKQGNQVGLDTILNIADKYPQYSLNWILFAEGEMRSEDSTIGVRHRDSLEKKFESFQSQTNLRLTEIEKGIGLLLLKSEEFDAEKINSAIEAIEGFSDSK